MNLVREMLLIEDPSIIKLYGELTTICAYFIPAMFLLAILFEFFGIDPVINNNYFMLNVINFNIG